MWALAQWWFGYKILLDFDEKKIGKLISVYLMRKMMVGHNVNPTNKKIKENGK